MKSPKVFYADHNATTPCSISATQAVLECLQEEFGNPNSTHIFGRMARERLSMAREQVAACLDCDFDDVVFTSGATEAINLFVKGIAQGKDLNFALSDIEHPAVLESVKARIKSGGRVETLSVDDQCRIKINHSLQADVVLFQSANSESGVIQDVAKLVKEASSNGSITFVDAAQSLWKMPISFREWGCDAMVVSAHKAYGPKGAGALIASKAIRNAIQKQIDGGTSSQRLRSGTENVPAYVGFGACCADVISSAKDWQAKVSKARDLFETLLISQSEGQISSKFSICERIPNTSSLTLKGVRADQFLIQMHDIAASYGSACSSGSFQPSKALLAFGLSQEEAESTIRFSFGADTAIDDIPLVVASVLRAIQCLKGSEIFLDN
jgi:cysteine desulfurase